MSLFHHEYHKDKSDEYATPRHFVDPIADAVGGFDLDPASGAEHTPIAPRRYTADDDGLSHEWFGTVWLNPPFSGKEEWLRKAYSEFLDGNVDLAVVLLPVDTSTGWFHEYVTEANVVWFKNGRLNFDGGGNRNRNPSFGVMLAVYGEPPEDLLKLLESWGEVYHNGERFRSTAQTRIAVGEEVRGGDR